MVKTEIFLRIYTKKCKMRCIAPIYIKINRLNVHYHWFTTYFTKFLTFLLKNREKFKPVSETIDMTGL